MIDFKEFDEPVEGSVTLPMTGDETAVLYLKDIVYARYGETIILYVPDANVSESTMNLNNFIYYHNI